MIATRVELTETSCTICGLPFAVPLAWWDARERTGGMLHCPTGSHSMTFGDTELKRLRREKETLQRVLANMDEDLRAERAGHRATRGRLTRATKQIERVEKGTCPHCKRHFVNVERHMASKHLDQARGGKHT